jgi:hypothetical protein
LKGNALKEVFDHICSLYNRSYKEKQPLIEDILRKVNAKRMGTRYFVKASVEALDLVRFNPGKPLDEVLR